MEPAWDTQNPLPEDVAEAEETSEGASEVMAQPACFAQGQCTLLDHLTPHQRHPQKQQGQKIPLGDIGQPQRAQDISNVHWASTQRIIILVQKQAEAQELPEGECHYNCEYDCDAHL